MNVYKVTYDVRTANGWVGGEGRDVALDSMHVIVRGDATEACAKASKRLAKSKTYGAVLEVMILSATCIARGAT